VSSVHERFAAALSARLNGQADEFSADGQPPRSPEHARRANVPDAVVAEAEAEALGLPYHRDLSRLSVSHDFLAKVPIAFARRHSIIGLAESGTGLTVVTNGTRQLSHVHSVAKLLGREVSVALAPHEAIRQAINAAYQQQGGQVQRVITELDGAGTVDGLETTGGNEDLLDVASRAPVIKLVSLMLFEAVKRRASDVHVQPYEDKLVVRMRVDGALHDIFTPPQALQQEILSRIKVMGGMNIAERRVAQDGRATVEVGDRIVDLRISTLPTTFGERAVIRLLDKSLRLYELGELGMPDAMLGSFSRLIRADHGILLVTGPTGSGKSTTLYAALQELHSEALNILTLEDPIEYRLEGISQTQVNPRKGMTFANGLRYVLRQDPDVIMVGEIRDAETARMAIQSALTGHLVFSTLHTNDAAGAVARLLDLGVEPYLLASCLLGVLAQRLVRRICPECSMVHTPSPAERQRWAVSEEELPADVALHRGDGCDACLGTGYHERVGIFEHLEVTEAIRELILQQAKASSIKATAVVTGMTTLRADGIAKALRGLTTMDEITRVAGRDEF